MPNVIMEKKRAVRRIVLNRPDRLNALDETLHRELAAALSEAEADETCRVVILTGTGRAFCTGQDLAERHAALDPPPDLGASLHRHYNPLARRLRYGPKPVIAAVNGIASGAGANLALVCDIVLAARSARFIQPFIRFGLVPDAGGTWILPRLVGAARARGLALTGEPLGAEQAEHWGLIWRCVDDDALAAETEALADRLAASPAEGVARIREALRRSADNGFEAQLELERALQRDAGLSPDYAEGVRAFMEKRPPRFA